MVMANSGIENGVEQIDEEVDDDGSGSHQQHDTWKTIRSRREDRADQQAADARQGKNRRR